jgi:mevalonate kinase
MPVFSASASGKMILFGEHAVVYGQPAIAVPVDQVRVDVRIVTHPQGTPGEMRILAPKINLDCNLEDLPPTHPLAAAVNGVLASQQKNIADLPACILEIISTIPVASGLGSGAAVSVAIIRALGKQLGRPLPDEQVSALAYDVEKIHHGTPSGIDNTVVTYAQSVYFQRGEPIEIFTIAEPFTIVIADTGVPSPTKEAVGDVRAAWQADPEAYERLFAAAGDIARKARQAIENGTPEQLGPLMDANHSLLQKMGVSSPELDRLVEAARQAGALGAKLSGSGRGGNMIALVSPQTAKTIARSLRQAGAVHTITTTVG